MGNQIEGKMGSPVLGPTSTHWRSSLNTAAHGKDSFWIVYRELSPVGRSHTGAGDNSLEQREAEMMCNQLITAPISCHSVLLMEGERELEIKLHWEEGKSWERYSSDL